MVGPMTIASICALMTNDIPSRRHEGDNFISPFIRYGLIENLFNSNPFPPKLCQVLEEGKNLMSTPTSWIKEELV